MMINTRRQNIPTSLPLCLECLIKLKLHSSGSETLTQFEAFMRLGYSMNICYGVVYAHIQSVLEVIGQNVTVDYWDYLETI